MAVTFTYYNNFKEQLLKSASPDLSSTTIKVALLTSSYTPDYDAHDNYDDLTNELVDASYTAGGNALDNKAVTQDDTNNEGKFDADDETFAALTGTFRYVALYYDSGTDSTSMLIGLYDLGGNVTVAAEDYKLAFHADGIINVA